MKSRLRSCARCLPVVALLLAVPPLRAAHSIARTWNEEILAAIRIDTPHPPAHARNLFHLSVAMYDAWAAYDTNAVGYLYRGKQTAGDVAAARREAISYAAYRTLRERYVWSKSASNTLALLDIRMLFLGYPTNNFSTNVATPAGLGNHIANVLTVWATNDGARQLVGYVDFPFPNGYIAWNQPLVTGLPGANTIYPNHWQPLAIANAVDQNGFPAGPIQTYLGPHWLAVRPFALWRTNSSTPWINPGPPPQLGGDRDEQFKQEVAEVIQRSSELTPDDGVMIDISPGAYGNNSLGTNDGTGHPLNPATGLPYPPNVVKRGDFARVLAEFWADGPNSETPPGHWNTLANGVSDHTNFVKRIGGVGPVLDNLEWDVKLYFALNAAVHEAGCAAWSLKRFYDGGRPISFIRYMGQLGQSSDMLNMSFNLQGLPLVSNLIEVVDPSSSQPGERHYGISVGQIAVRTWPGQPADPVNQYSGVRWIRAAAWLPYQKANFVTPAFPGYISGHSTFSRSAAEVLTAITGSPFFPGGMATYTSVSNTSLSFERGPSQTLQLQWGTYYDAADQAGISRLYGGIHVAVDDLTGRRVGSQCGIGVWNLARKYFDGSVTNTPVHIAQRVSGGNCVLQCNTQRGFYYKLQSTTNLNVPFTDDGGGFTRDLDAVSIRTSPVSGGSKFYRVVMSPTGQ